jgi:hypothetical protein
MHARHVLVIWQPGPSQSRSLGSAGASVRCERLPMQSGHDALQGLSHKLGRPMSIQRLSQVQAAQCLGNTHDMQVMADD